MLRTQKNRFEGSVSALAIGTPIPTSDFAEAQPYLRDI